MMRLETYARWPMISKLLDIIEEAGFKLVLPREQFRKTVIEMSRGEEIAVGLKYGTVDGYVVIAYRMQSGNQFNLWVYLSVSEYSIWILSADLDRGEMADHGLRLANVLAREG